MRTGPLQRHLQHRHPNICAMDAQVYNRHRRCSLLNHHLRHKRHNTLSQNLRRPETRCPPSTTELLAGGLLFVAHRRRRAAPTASSASPQVEHGPGPESCSITRYIPHRSARNREHSTSRSRVQSVSDTESPSPGRNNLRRTI